MPPATRQPKPPKSRTVAWKDWKGANKTDARTSLSREEFAWLENALSVGKGAAQILPGPGDAIATIAAGVVSCWGFTLNGAPVLLTHLPQVHVVMEPQCGRPVGPQVAVYQLKVGRLDLN